MHLNKMRSWQYSTRKEEDEENFDNISEHVRRDYVIGFLEQAKRRIINHGPFSDSSSSSSYDCKETNDLVQLDESKNIISFLSIKSPPISNNQINVEDDEIELIESHADSNATTLLQTPSKYLLIFVKMLSSHYLP